MTTASHSKAFQVAGLSEPHAGVPASLWQRAWAGFAAAAIAAPTFGTLLTLFLYVRRDTWDFSAGEVLVWGLIGAVGAWALMAAVLAARSTPRGANPLMGAHIETRLGSLNESLTRISAEAGRANGVLRGTHWKEIQAQLDKEIGTVSNCLARPSMDWFTGSAFLAAWQSIHHIEEEMMLYLPDDDVVAESLLDYSRLRGSGIEDSVLMEQRLERAMKTVSPCIDLYISPRSGPECCAKAPEPAEDLTECQRNTAARTARVVVADVRRKINRYRDERWATVVRQKQQFLGAALSLSFGAYVFAVLAVVRGAPDQAIVGGAVFFGVGAMAGLLAQLVVAREATPLVDDYGYSKTRLAFTPLVSGVAALVGVWLVAASVTFTVNPDPEAGETQTEVPSLSKVFDFVDNRASLIVAAAFGIAPAAAINRIQQGVVDAKKDLQATAAPGSSRNDSRLLS